jgi:hypothetical protein
VPLSQLGQHVGDGSGVVRVDIQQQAEVTELEIAVDESDRLVKVGCGGDGQIGGEGRSTHAAFRGEDSNHLPASLRPTGTVGPNAWADRYPVQTVLALPRRHLSDRAKELV